MGLGIRDEFPGTGRTVGEELLSIHRSYLKVLDAPLEAGIVNGLAHVTGGGIPGNLPRVLPPGLGAVLDREAWPVPKVFQTLQQAGGVDRQEMDRVFNMGIGMLVAVAPRDAAAINKAAGAHGFESWTVGIVEEGSEVTYR